MVSKPTGRPRGRPRRYAFDELDRLIVERAQHVMRNREGLSPSAAIREVVSALWKGDIETLCSVAWAFLDQNLPGNGRAFGHGEDGRRLLGRLPDRRAFGQSETAVVRRVMGRLEPTTYRWTVPEGELKGKVMIATTGPLIGSDCPEKAWGSPGSAVAGRLDRRRGPRRKPL